jgi:hypothetical protein
VMRMRVTLVSAPDCHLCTHGRAIVERIAQDGVPLEVQELDWTDSAGTALVMRDGVPFPPALYVDGELWGYGRLSERALRKKFEARSAGWKAELK